MVSHDAIFSGWNRNWSRRSLLVKKNFTQKVWSGEAKKQNLALIMWMLLNLGIMSSYENSMGTTMTKHHSDDEHPTRAFVTVINDECSLMTHDAVSQFEKLLVATNRDKDWGSITRLVVHSLWTTDELPPGYVSHSLSHSSPAVPSERSQAGYEPESPNWLHALFLLFTWQEVQKRSICCQRVRTLSIVLRS